MDDDSEKPNLEKDVSRQSFSNMFNVSPVLQPIWVRCGSVFSNVMDRKFMESQLRFVLRCGSIFWILFILEKII